MPTESHSRSSLTEGNTSLPAIEEIVELPIQSQSWSWFFFGCGMALALLGGFICFVAPSALIERLSAFRFFWVPFAGACLFLGIRLRVLRTFEELRADTRPPVLYLRAFSDDAALFKPGQPAAAWEEVTIVDKLSEFGPVVAIGRPRARLGHLGAARLFLRRGDWRQLVSKLITSSSVVALRASNTSGVRWELACARQSLSPKRFVLWFPSTWRKEEYDGFRQELLAELRIELPINVPVGYVTFDSRWTAHAPSAMFPPIYFDPSEARAWSVSLVDRLNRQGIALTAPPPFTMHWLAALILVGWLGACMLIPGSRTSFMVMDLMEIRNEYLDRAFEASITLLVALALTYLPYMRWPAARWVPTTLFCATLLLSTSWVVARADVARHAQSAPADRKRPTLSLPLMASGPYDARSRADQRAFLVSPN